MFPYLAVVLLVTTASLPQDSLSVATFNVQALSGRDSDGRFEQVAKVIAEGGFPQIVALQEIADDDGEIDSQTNSAELTLERLLLQIREHGGPQYQAFSVDPQLDADGGPPGANIRTVVLSTLLGRSDAVHTVGTANHTFDNTRKPLLVQLSYADTSIDVIAVHLSAGPTRREKRRLQARDLANFINSGLRATSPSNTLLLGDFNAEEDEDVWPILSLAGLTDSTTFPRIPTHASGHTFDRIWSAGKTMALRPAHVLRRNPVSDHALVWAELQLAVTGPNATGGCNVARTNPGTHCVWLVLVGLAFLYRRRRARAI